jgi:MFS family permease
MNHPQHSLAEPGTTSESQVRKVAGACFIGTTLEWYDYFLYGTAAALVFNDQFFPTSDPVVGTLLSFLTFAVGFIARPVGAAFFGHLGDRRGRKIALIITVTMMGLTTGLIGVLPNYASIGVAAPIILTILRFAQGFSVGGEWAGAMLMAIEHAPPERRGWYAAVPQFGSPFGTLLSSGLFALVGLLPHDDFASWGWRIPFLFAFVLLLLGLYLRSRVEESPLFRKALEEERTVRLPIAEVLAQGWGRVVAGIFAPLICVGGFYLLTTFMISYTVNDLGLPTQLALNATLAAAAFEVLVLFVFGRLTDRLGAARICILGGIVSAVLAFPVFWLVDTKQPALVILGIVIGIGSLSIPYAPIGMLVSQMFSDETRYSGVSLSYNLSGVVSGFVPAMAVAMYALSGGLSWGPATLLVLIALASIGGTMAASQLIARRRYV